MQPGRASASPVLKGFVVAMIAAAPISGAIAQDINERQLIQTQPVGNGQFQQQSRLPLLAQAQFDVPPLIERPLVVDQGPRLVVREYRLTGAVDRPDSDISVAELNGMLRSHLARQPVDGYTVNQMAEAADDLTQYYRERGLILAQAYVPAQDVQNGVVEIAVLEGTLGGVTVQQNEMYRDEVVSGPFNRLLGQPVVQRDVEEALLLVQEFPGLTAFGTFTAGQRVGATDLLIQVRDEDRLQVTPMVDNYGSKFTGEQRFSLTFDINNPFGARDRITGFALKTYSPDNGDYGGLDYQLRTRSGRGQFGIGASSNSFDVTDPTSNVSLGLQGEVDQQHFFYTRNFSQGRAYRAAGTIDVAYRDGVSHQPGADPRDELTNLSYTFDYFAAGRKRRGINLGYIRLLSGDNDSLNSARLNSSFDSVTGSFSKIELSYQRLQRFNPVHSLLFRVQGQYTDDLLVPLEQMALGGPINVRGYPVAEEIVDKGGFASLEWIIVPASLRNKSAGSDRRTGITRSWADIFQFSIFYDYASGHVHDPLPNQLDNVSLKGYGMGFQFSASERFYVRVDVATPGDSVDPLLVDDRQYYVSANLTF